MARRPEYQAPPEIYYGVDESRKYTNNTRIITIQRVLAERCMELCMLPMLRDNTDGTRENSNLPAQESDSEEMSESDSEEVNGQGQSKGRSQNSNGARGDMNDDSHDQNKETQESQQTETQQDGQDQYQLDPKLVLDIGCGSGLSGEILSEHGHEWIGTDISTCMLDIANDRDVDGDLILHDMGHGLPFRAGTFDAAISVSAIQWLCNQDKSCNNPARRLRNFFESLYSCLKHGGKAALQFYPENADQAEFIQSSAIKAGFTGGLITDFPNSAKKKKHYLLLFCGVKREDMALPEGQKDQLQTKAKFGKRERLCDLKRKGKISKIDWINAKKEKRRRQGKNTARDSKYTGRKRGPKF